MFTVVGEALLDMLKDHGGGYLARPGGGPLNTAVGLRRLGHPTALMSRISTSALGEVVRQYAESAQLDLSACVSTPEPATLAFATVQADGTAWYDFYAEQTADWGWTIEELDHLPTGSRVVHTGSLTAAIEPGAGRLLAWFQRLSSSTDTFLSFDPNVRPALAGSHERAVERAESFVACAHLVKVSHQDLEWLYPRLATTDAMLRWSRLGQRLGPRLVVMTRGERGCVAVKADQTIVEWPPAPVAVVDTIGAGDAFASGLLSGLADAGCSSPGALEAMSAGTLATVLDRATMVAGLTCGHDGADPPTRTAYDEAIKARDERAAGLCRGH